MSTAAGSSAPDAPSAEPILLREDTGGVATLTLNRPQHYNALSEPLLDAMQEAFDELATDGRVRVVIIAANGPAFSAGHDLKEIRSRPDQAYYEGLFKKCSHMMLTMLRLPQPVIARVHGLATAAGCQLVATCDLAVASTEARFGTSGINVGLFCMTPGVALSRNIARKDAFEMLFTGELLPAGRAKSMGLVNRVVAPPDLDDAIAELCRSITEKSRTAVAAGKAMFYRQLEMTLAAAYDTASEGMAENLMLHDAGEGIDAFIGKRRPVWLHE